MHSPRTVKYNFFYFFYLEKEGVVFTTRPECSNRISMFFLFKWRKHISLKLPFNISIKSPREVLNHYLKPSLQKASYSFPIALEIVSPRESPNLSLRQHFHPHLINVDIEKKPSQKGIWEIQTRIHDVY